MVHSLLTDEPAVLFDIMQDLDDRTRIATTDSARARMTAWSACAVTATEDSSGKAHNFSRTKTGTVDDKGLGMATGSRGVLLGYHALEWLPLWQNTNRGIVDLD